MQHGSVKIVSITVANAVAVPNAPTLNTATAGNGQVALGWTDNSGNETGFKVYYKPTAGGNWTLFTTTAANATSATVTGLNNGTSYDFRIDSANSAGDATGNTKTATPVAPADTTPDAFTFTDQTGVALSTVIESAAITVSGINTASAISVTGGEYSINGGAW
ncbi:MAG TPA: fibronectin type III domain-containing protein, partial [Smithellaceae bacterium]|nr:fibronectin type III domain-containing protein [Smithellaceae bacterium]